MELGRLLKLSIPEIKVRRRKTGTWRIKTQGFCQENPKAGEINYGMKVHGSNMGIDTTNHGIIARLCYCHRAELSMQMHGRIGW